MSVILNENFLFAVFLPLVVAFIVKLTENAFGSVISILLFYIFMFDLKSEFA